VDEFAHVTEADLRSAMPILASLALPLLVHAELPTLLRQPSGDPRQYATWLNSRPPVSELAAIDFMITLARETKARVHIVHLASPAALASIADAQRSGCAITVETCPHYLTFAAESIGDGETPYKCAPPIRGKHDRELLWTGLANGSIDLVASDHSPAPPALKLTDTGDFLRAWGGISSLQLGLCAVWTGAHTRGLPFAHLARWMASAPAALAGLTHRKGAIAPGHDADLVVWDPDGSTTVDPAMLYSRHGLTPYAGMTLDGRVRTTLLRGDVVFDEESGVSATPRGRLLAKGV
jgi:allantoinase